MPSVRDTASTAPIMAACLIAISLAAGRGEAAMIEIGGVTFNTDNATVTATIESGGYYTVRGTALHSGTSPDWGTSTTPLLADDSLGTYFQVPTFQLQPPYSPDQDVFGLPGSAVTLGQDANFPETSMNERDIIRLGWGGLALPNGLGDDLVIYEAATSEAFTIQAHIVDSSGDAVGWTGWYYRPYWEPADRPDSSIANDTTPTLFDLSALDVGTNEYIDILEIANLLPDDTLGAEITAVTDHAPVFFHGETPPGETSYPLLRYSNSGGTFVGFADTKFDPDIQYAAGLHDVALLGSGTGATSPLHVTAGLSFPERLAATGSPAPAPGTPLLLIPLLWLLARRTRGTLNVHAGPATAPA